MFTEHPSEVKLEIGHVLFMDIVGYSQLLITQQSEQIETLRRIVRGTTQFRAAEAEGNVLRLPTGDGAALVFQTTPAAPVLCALEIATELKKHLELDPLSLIINTDFSWTYLIARRFDDAEAQARETIKMDPRFFRAHYYLGAVLQLKGNIAGAIPEFQRSFDLNGDPYSLAMLGQAYARNGQKDEAQKVLARLNEEAKTRYVAPYAFAVLYLGLAEKERALDELERAYELGNTNRLFGIKVDPFLDELRDHPRFQALLQKVVGQQK